MATMKRNVNLEEIDTDAFMGIKFLSHQTLGQKAIFFGSILCSIALTFVGGFALHLNQNLIMLFTLGPLLIGVLFGANYNQDYSLFQYIVLLIKKPVIRYVSMPVEDITHLREIRHKLEADEEQRNKTNEMSEGFKKKMLLMLGLGAIILVALVVLIIVIGKGMNAKEVHHTVGVIIQNRGVA